MQDILLSMKRLKTKVKLHIEYKKQESKLPRPSVGAYVPISHGCSTIAALRQ